MEKCLAKPVAQCPVPQPATNTAFGSTGDALAAFRRNACKVDGQSGVGSTSHFGYGSTSYMARTTVEVLSLGSARTGRSLANSCSKSGSRICIRHKAAPKLPPGLLGP